MRTVQFTSHSPFFPKLVFPAHPAYKQYSLDYEYWTFAKIYMKNKDSEGIYPSHLEVPYFMLVYLSLSKTSEQNK